MIDLRDHYNPDSTPEALLQELLGNSALSTFDRHDIDYQELSQDHFSHSFTPPPTPLHSLYSYDPEGDPR